MKISLGVLNVLMPQHFFDLINGSAKKQKILGMGMPEPIGRRRKPRILHGSPYVASHALRAEWTIGPLTGHEQIPVLRFNPDMKDIDGYGLHGLLWNGEGDGAIALSFRHRQYFLRKRDIIKSDSADLNRSKGHGIGQVNYGVGSYGSRGGKIQS